MECVWEHLFLLKSRNQSPTNQLICELTHLKTHDLSHPDPPGVNVSSIAIYRSLKMIKTLENIQIWKGMNFTNGKLRKDEQ